MGEVISASWRRAAIILYAAIVLAIGWGYGLWRIQSDREVALDASRQQLATLSRGLASQIQAMVNDGVGAARAGANALRDVPMQADPGRILGDMLTGGHYVRALFIVAGDKMTIANASGETLTQAEASWVQAMNSSTEAVWVGPIVAESDGLKVPIAHRIQGSGGASAWAGALVQISDLEDVYRELSNTTLSIITLAGRVLVQLPAPRDHKLDLDISHWEVFRRFSYMPAQPVTLLVGKREDTGDLRQYAVTRLEPLPLLATASRPIDDILSEWRERKLLSLQLLSVASAVVIAMAIALQLLLNRRFIALEALAEARRSELHVKESLARELLHAQEQERKRLAGELHDGVGQSLSLLRNRAVLLQRTALPPEAGPHVQALLELSTDSIQELRSVAQNLRPMHLEELGISASLRSLLQRVAAASELKVDYRVEDIDEVLTPDAATHVYRIVQEAVSNVVRHAAAANLRVEVIRDIDSVGIDIRDDGKGCDSPTAVPASGLGLMSIRERCGILRASLAIHSGEKRGTRITIRIPLGADHV